MLFSNLLRQAPAVVRRIPIAPCRSMPVLAPTRCLAPMTRVPARSMFGLVPRNQYVRPRANKMVISYALWHHWETIPLFLVTVFNFLFFVGGAILSAINNKVDLQWTKHNWNCISRNMDMLNPTVHKHLTFFQTYEPWPEMHIVLHKMKRAEHRLLVRQNSCKHP